MSYQLAKGDHVSVSRGLYTHHGIYTGNGTVIHYSGEPGSKRNATIREDWLEHFVNGGRLEVVSYDEEYPAWRVLQHAHSRLGENGYDLFGNNCEHFARWCKIGDHKSAQADTALVLGGAGVAIAALRFAGPGGALLSALLTLGLRQISVKRPGS